MGEWEKGRVRDSPILPYSHTGGVGVWEYGGGRVWGWKGHTFLNLKEEVVG
jgi:hypothetical protein